jgi:hypothetical protein
MVTFEYFMDGNELDSGVKIDRKISVIEDLLWVCSAP